MVPRVGLFATVRNRRGLTTSVEPFDGPTGRLHLGNYWGALRRWVELQKEHRCFFMVADFHMFTTGYARTGLGRRIALWLIRRMGAKTLGLGYAVAVADLLLAAPPSSEGGADAGTVWLFWGTGM